MREDGQITAEAVRYLLTSLGQIAASLDEIRMEIKELNERF